MKTAKQDRVLIFDTTLRDGEQCPGASLNQREKIEIAQQLVRLNVDVIEAGFPIASPDDFCSVKAIAETIKGPRIAGLARCLNKDIERCAEAVMPAGQRGRIHVFLATSPIHRQYKLKKDKAEILKQAAASVRYARKFCEDVEFSAEDASRTEPDFLAQVTGAVIDAGAATVNIPDTVGYAVPGEFGALIGYLFEHVPNIGKAVINVHCHNDLGLAVANTLAALAAGARGVECTINGLGERAGNCALEEVIMALRTRHDRFDLSTGICTQELFRASRLVSRLTGMVVQRNKAIVGANAFAHEAGIHQDGILKERSTYEIMRPQDIGIDGSELVLGKHSGRHAFSDRLTKMGFKLKLEELDHAYRRFIDLADKKKNVYDDDILAIARDEMEGDLAGGGAYQLDYLHVSTGTSTIPTATVRLRKGKDVIQDAACGDGPVDAALKTIDRITGVRGKLLEYAIQAVTIGKDAQGEVSMRVAFGDDMVSGKAASTDIVQASATAYLNCVNRILQSRALKA
ncbi:MAG: 2-isopropylmalate synthase [Kiritimatiellaeota bacterium]|nr:2-isopropylmalate synthase [Kiritimatiellota bacterium]